MAINTTIEDCHNSNTSTAIDSSGVEVRGGIVGWASHCWIRRCSVRGGVPGGQRARSVSLVVYNSILWR